MIVPLCILAAVCYYLPVAVNTHVGVKRVERCDRLKRLSDILASSEEPHSGACLAAELGVSRQAVVQDIAILREQGFPVMATSRGYVLRLRSHRFRKTVAVHHEPEDIADELGAIVDNGGRVVDVIVDHPVYGELRGNIDVSTREEAARFVNLLLSTGQNPLLNLSGGFHLHTLEARDEATMDSIENALREKGFLPAFDNIALGSGKGDTDNVEA